eukprot:CAMPEP_0204837242 /NCGR_PEP_ID=MMETSP1346-20131115/27313_1 /ASSEMBLY_ACC=CAM_ASM_000771 /TAXON_ID=215587 /ORGANISM="Aplanochytrium stocchinoi, Strain GSBS06" /LENGTH=37 /DNA_ID= /DNA_START= /DNA_END= /DNA_ORIENTATION=
MPVNCAEMLTKDDIVLRGSRYKYTILASGYTSTSSSN